MYKSINFGTLRGKPSNYDNILTLLSHGLYDICEIIIMAWPVQALIRPIIKNYHYHVAYQLIILSSDTLSLLYWY